MASAYTPSQISDYLTSISLPPHLHPTANPPLDLALLTSLHIYQLAAIPYDNLSLHYSRAHAAILDPQVLYAKFAGGRGRGGYCMENSIFFNHVLRALGFSVYLAGVRIRYRVNGVPGGSYIGWVHVVNIVTLADGSKYALDVGFGGDGPTHPMPLVSGVVSQNLGTQEVRLVHGNIPEQTDKSQKLWIYQYRNGEDQEWNSFYSFPETEFMEPDFHIMNWYTGSHPESFQTYTALVVRFLMGEGEEAGRIGGKVMLVNGLVKRNLGGRTEVVVECTSEDERVEALKEYFGITLTEEEREAIKGTRTELVKKEEVVP